MQPFTKLKAIAAPIDLANIDTDRIFPARFLRRLRGPDYSKLAFHDMRYDADGKERPEFVLNQAPYRAAKIIVAGGNFGCGSSREAAVYVMYDHGIRAVIAPSFGDIHYGNELQNGMLPVILPDAIVEDLRKQLHAKPGAEIAIDLEAQTVTAPDGVVHKFEIDPNARERLLNGLDDIGLVLQNLPEIERFEREHAKQMPWLA